MPGHEGPPARRLLVVSHPAVVAANQAVYESMVDLGWDVRLVVPASWRHDYADAAFAPAAAPGLDGRLETMRIVLPGRVQRHLYVGRLGAAIRRAAPAVAFVEAETFSLPAAQWAVALHRRGVPFGVQADENLERRLHPAAVLAERLALRRAAFVAARSPRAQELVEAKRHAAVVRVIPHAVPRWEAVRDGADQPFTVGYAGRLVPEKGLDDLVAAVRGLEPPVRLLLVGNGPLRERLAAADAGRNAIEVVTDLPHERMARAYARMDVLVLPSRSTPTWEEQFGRVLVEALWCGVPVIGSETGEIPWVVGTTGGGLTYPEGDVAALRDRIEALRSDPAARADHARRGRARVEELFSVDAVARALSDLLDEVARAPAAPGR